MYTTCDLAAAMVTEGKTGFATSTVSVGDNISEEVAITSVAAAVAAELLILPPISSMAGSPF